MPTVRSRRSITTRWTISKRAGTETAAALFDELERQHPYSAWATKAQLMAAYSNHQQGYYDEAIIGLDRFIELHPGHRDTGYAYYLKAISFYKQISDVGRDQKMTRLALASLRT